MRLGAVRTGSGLLEHTSVICMNRKKNLTDVSIEYIFHLGIIAFSYLTIHVDDFVLIELHSKDQLW